ncbi:MAG: cold shock domain-containing protein [Candidatus Woesebacteria bacterium]|nr:MAG: cold shock domain-containing protein [Candidatus Woesebacteria bacterium]
METGTVKWFDAREGKKFGFVTAEDGKEIFFHYNDGRPIQVNVTKRRVEFSDQPTFQTKDGVRRLRDPKPGDKIVFVRTQGYKGDKASPWSFKSIHDKAIDQIAKLPEPTVYRALETMNNVGDVAGEPKVLWEGSDLEALLAKYPVPSGRQSPGSDPLIPYYSDSDNIFEIRHWFEKKVGEIWEQCPDPRLLSGANRQFERITNRW